MRGVEPPSQAWEARILPLNYIRENHDCTSGARTRLGRAGSQATRLAMPQMLISRPTARRNLARPGRNSPSTLLGSLPREWLMMARPFPPTSASPSAVMNWASRLSSPSSSTMTDHASVACMDQICDDLDAEFESLHALVERLAATDWSAQTPAEGWTIQDSIGHLAFFNDKAVLAYREPEAFAALLAEVVQDPDRLESDHLHEIRSCTGREVIVWWEATHSELLAVYRKADPKERVLWYGPPMAAKSKITARLMETFAHGQDIADALGVKRKPTDRLRHICHLGVRTRAFSYMINELPPPDVEVFVDLRGPSGDAWTWGDPDAESRITGSGLDFALVAVQRRHRVDTDLVATGSAAIEWLSIIQAYAGPPGQGRLPA